MCCGHVRALCSHAKAARQNLGEYARRITADRPWSTTRDAADGTHWNFWWCGHPHAYVYTPDRRLTRDDSHFALRPDEVADRPVTWWLEHRSDAWILTDDRT